MNLTQIKFAGYQPPRSIHNQAATIFGEALQKRLGDRVSFKLDGDITQAGQSLTDLQNMVEDGTLNMCYLATSYLAKRVPELSLFDLPFLINDREQAYRILDGPLAGVLADKLATATGFRLLGLWDNGFRHFSNRMRPIRKPDDCLGLRIRTLLSDLHGQTFQLLGFEPVPLDVKELVSSVQNGDVDAQENPLTNYYNFDIHKHHRYVTLSGHFFGVAGLLCNNAIYESWPAEVQNAVNEAAIDATAHQRSLAAAEDVDVLDKLNPDEVEITHLSDCERDLFVKTVAPIIGKYRAILGDELFGYLS